MTISNDYSIKLNYRWELCGGLKNKSMILGQRSGYTKYLCSFMSGVVPTSNTLRKKINSLLLIKLGFREQFVKAANKKIINSVPEGRKMKGVFFTHKSEWWAITLQNSIKDVKLQVKSANNLRPYVNL